MVLSKQMAAIVSVAASLLLTTIKIAVGIITGSLSILAEAVDSSLDLLAAGVTFLVVRVADLPPDENHPYGHARAENLGSLAQAVLLIATAALIIWHAIDRIVFAPSIPEVTFWSFLVVGASLFINVLRIYTLRRAAAQSSSRTIAANVANFTNDILSSALVFITLILISMRGWLPLPLWLVERADALAALFVALVAVRVAWTLGSDATRALMDDVPPDLNRALTSRVSQLPEVVPDSTRVRTRFVGEQPYVEVLVGTPRGRSLEEAHQLATDIEEVVRDELREASVLVHVEPARMPAEPLATAVYSTAQHLGHRIHNLDLYQLSDELLVKMDLELPGSLTLGEAQVQAQQLTAAVAADLPCNARVVVHLEPRRDQLQPAVRYPPLNERVGQALQSLSVATAISETETLLTDKGIVVTLHCQFTGATLLTEVHDAMADIEHELRRVMPEIVSIQISPHINNQRVAHTDHTPNQASKRLTSGAPR
jgi:cation diffusion facilitator family transporter